MTVNELSPTEPVSDGDLSEKGTGRSGSYPGFPFRSGAAVEIRGAVFSKVIQTESERVY